MKQIRKRLTYANVMSSIAVFLVLGGATAFAAGQLGKNSVGSKQLKKNSVTAAKIKKNAVTGAKIKANAVTGAKVKDGSLTGADINLGTLGTVPSASNSDAVDGMHLGKLHFVSGPDAPKAAIFSASGLTLYAECVSEALEFTATTSVPNSEIYYSGNYTNVYNGGFDDSFQPGDTANIGQEIADASRDEVQGQLVFSTPAGANVTAEFYLNDFESYGGTANCSVQGTVVYEDVFLGARHKSAGHPKLMTPSHISRAGVLLVTAVTVVFLPGCGSSGGTSDSTSMMPSPAAHATRTKSRPKVPANVKRSHSHFSHKKRSGDMSRTEERKPAAAPRKPSVKDSRPEGRQVAQDVGAPPHGRSSQQDRAAKRQHSDSGRQDAAPRGGQPPSHPDHSEAP